MNPNERAILASAASPVPGNGRGLDLLPVASVGPAAPAISTETLPDGTIDVAYSQALAATGFGSLTWELASGSLPAGLTLSSGGTIAGTPTGAETANFTVRVTDQAGRTDTQALSIVVAVGGFLDGFGGSASDPALDATKWTQRVRTGGGGDLGDGSTGVNTAMAGKMVCQRVNGGSYGVFAGFITELEPAEDFVVSFTLKIDGNAPSNWNELRLKCTDKLANGVTDGPANGYVVQLDIGNACQVRRHDAGWPGSQIGSTFDGGLTLDTESDVVVTTTVLADRVRIVVNVDGVDKIVAEDTSGSRITAKGFTGICLESSVAAGHHTIVDDFARV